MPPKPAVRLTLEYDNDPGGAADALLAVLAPRRAPHNERIPVPLDQASENAPTTTPEAKHAQK